MKSILKKNRSMWTTSGFIKSRILIVLCNAFVFAFMLIEVGSKVLTYKSHSHVHINYRWHFFLLKSPKCRCIPDVMCRWMKHGFTEKILALLQTLPPLLSPPQSTEKNIQNTLGNWFLRLGSRIFCSNK